MFRRLLHCNIKCLLFDLTGDKLKDEEIDEILQETDVQEDLDGNIKFEGNSSMTNTDSEIFMVFCCRNTDSRKKNQQSFSLSFYLKKYLYIYLGEKKQMK